MTMHEQVVVLVPAHNEEERLPATLGGLWEQTILPYRVIVVSDNSTDNTVQIAKAGGADVIETVGNRNKKSGALNQALDALALPDETYVLIVDADTVLAPNWIEVALETFRKKENIGAIGGIFLGDGKNGWLGAVQGLEYARYRKELYRIRGNARVLTGTSTMMPMRVFRDIRDARTDGRLPGSGYYNVSALTEDYEITICVKRLGLRAVSPAESIVVTETMGTVPDLWRQRVRWTRGAFDVLTMHGIGRVTVPYWWRQLETLLGVVVNASIWTLAGVAFATGSFQWSMIWLLIGLVFLVERVGSSLVSGTRGVVIATTVILDAAYDVFISVVWVWCIALTIAGKRREWGESTIDVASEGA